MQAIWFGYQKNQVKFRIVFWNCNDAFRGKFKVIQRFNANIYVIQESEYPKVTEEYKKFANNYLCIIKKLP